MRRSISNKQNIVPTSDIRRSLKLTDKNKSFDKNQGRMSMLPLKRQRLSIAVENSLTRSRPSILTSNLNILNASNQNYSEITNNCQKSMRKDTIINNLVNKLDEQEEIRSIIETKLRKNNYSTNKQFTYTSEFHLHSNFLIKNSQRTLISPQSKTQLNQKHFLSAKLKNCQAEIQSFKQIIFKMAEKMKRMENSSNNETLEPKSQQVSSRLPNPSKFKPLSQNIPEKNYIFCPCSIQKRQISVQTDPENVLQSTSEFWQDDFFDSLQRTLSVLQK